MSQELQSYSVGENTIVLRYRYYTLKLEHRVNRKDVKNGWCVTHGSDFYYGCFSVENVYLWAGTFATPQEALDRGHRSAAKMLRFMVAVQLTRMFTASGVLSKDEAERICDDHSPAWV